MPGGICPVCGRRVQTDLVRVGLHDLDCPNRGLSTPYLLVETFVFSDRRFLRSLRIAQDDQSTPPQGHTCKAA